MNVLSLFDGSSCGQVALERCGIKVDNYFASEIDKWGIQITQKNYPNTIQVGDVRFLSARVVPDIDLILAGSPCQGFSFAGKRLAFEDPRSALFFEFFRILEECRRYNPDVKFLLENVRMIQEYQDIITDYLGVEPVAINSSLVSAQNRYRLYWCNWDVTQPEDRGLTLKDVLVEGVADTVSMKGTKVMKQDLDKAHCLLGRDYKGFGNQRMTGVRVGRMVGRRINPDTGKRDDYNYEIPIKQRIEPRKDERSGCLTTVEKDNLVVEKGTYRPLLPIEMERLQTLPDNYTEGVSNTQRKKMLGNGWTVDVISHILKEGELV